MKGIKDHPYLIVIFALMAGILALAGWLMWMIYASTIDNTHAQVRAITAAEHGRCAAMPRGSQEMEDRRHDCFKALYTPPWTRVD